MSCYWDVYCRSCGVGADVWCNSITPVSDIIKVLSYWRHVDVAMAGWVDLRSPAFESGVSGLSEFARKHHEHDVVARSEYGAEHEVPRWQEADRG
jgi:hypothetical protein